MTHPLGIRGRDAPEHDGCEHSESCLTCRLTDCRYDDPSQFQRENRRDRDEGIRESLDGGATRKEAAARAGVSERSVFRAQADVPSITKPVQEKEEPVVQETKLRNPAIELSEADKAILDELAKAPKKRMARGKSTDWMRFLDRHTQKILRLCETYGTTPVRKALGCAASTLYKWRATQAARDHAGDQEERKVDPSVDPPGGSATEERPEPLADMHARELFRAQIDRLQGKVEAQEALIDKLIGALKG